MGEGPLLTSRAIMDLEHARDGGLERDVDQIEEKKNMDRVRFWRSDRRLRQRDVCSQRSSPRVESAARSRGRLSR